MKIIGRRSDPGENPEASAIRPWEAPGLRPGSKKAPRITGGLRFSLSCIRCTSKQALVKYITLNHGIVGWGEAQAPLAPEVVCAIVDLLLNPVLLGEDFDGSLDRIEWLWQRMYATMRVRGQTGGFMLDAISGIDLALWDLAGKIQGKPVSALIPGAMARQRVRAYCSGLTGATTEDRLRNAMERQAEGFSIFKLFFDSGRGEFLALATSMLREKLGPAR